VVAAHGDRPLRDQFHHGVDRPFGIGAIADKIAEKDETLGAAPARSLEAGLKSLPVSVYVRKQCQPHAFLPAQSCFRTGYR
jgi:hypothetical protein